LYLSSSFADATLYGNIDQAYTKSTTTVAGAQTASTTGMSSYQMGSSAIGVKGAEDLGGGLKASFLHEMGVNTEENTSEITRQAYIGLSGNFGAVRIGKQYSAAFFNLLNSDPFGATGGTGALYVNNILVGNGTGADNPLRQDQAIQYELPTFVPGLRAVLTKVFAGTDTTDGSGEKTGDSTGYGFVYASGPLNIGFTSDSITGQDIAAIASSTVAAYVDDDGVGVAAVTTAGVDAAAGSKTKLTTLALGYDLGMAKLTFSDAKIMNAGKGVKATMYGIAVPLGATTLMATQSNGKANALAGDTKLKGMQYGANYALSKRTVAYFHANNSTSTTVANKVTKVKGLGIGVHHSF
jgi:predicted porin